jgi:hypothetical protein
MRVIPIGGGSAGPGDGRIRPSGREPQARRLSRAGKDYLISWAAVDLSARLRVEEDDSEGTTHYHATYLARFWLGDLEGGRISEADARLLQRFVQANPDAVEGDGLVELRVGYGTFTVVASWDGQPSFDALDAESGDLATVGEALLAGYEDLMDDLGGADPGVVIVDQVHIQPAWRSLRLGLIGTGLTVRELGRGASMAVLYPMEPGIDEEDRRAASRERLTRYWGRLGFEPWTDEVMALSLIHTTFEKRLARLCRTTGRR